MGITEENEFSQFRTRRGAISPPIDPARSHWHGSGVDAGAGPRSRGRVCVRDVLRPCGGECPG